MTRRSKRELERELDAIGADTSPGDALEIDVTETIVGSEWDGSDLGPGETRTETFRIALGGEDS